MDHGTETESTPSPTVPSGGDLMNRDGGGGSNNDVQGDPTKSETTAPQSASKSEDPSSSLSSTNTSTTATTSAAANGDSREQPEIMATTNVTMDDVNAKATIDAAEAEPAAAAAAADNAAVTETKAEATVEISKSTPQIESSVAPPPPPPPPPQSSSSSFSAASIHHPGRRQSSSHSKPFVKKTKRRVVDNSERDVLEALIVTETQQETNGNKNSNDNDNSNDNNHNNNSKTWQIRLVVNDCQFPSGKPVPHRQQPFSISTISFLTGLPRSTNTSSGWKQKQKQNPPARRTRSNSTDALSSGLLDDADGRDEGTTADDPVAAVATVGVRKTRRQLQQEQQQMKQKSNEAAGALVQHVPILEHQISQDGNYHYCAICKLTGEVVCCDGCPQVYHSACMPVDEPARVTLELYPDDDEWFCPDCRAKQDGRPSPVWQVAAVKAAARKNNATDRIPIVDPNVPTSKSNRRPPLSESAASTGGGRSSRTRTKNSTATVASSAKTKATVPVGRGRKRGGLPTSSQSSQHQQQQQTSRKINSKRGSAGSSASPGIPARPSTPTRKSPMRDAKRNARELEPDDAPEEIDYDETDSEEMTDVEDNMYDSPPESEKTGRLALLRVPSRKRGGKRSRNRKEQDEAETQLSNSERKKRGRPRSRSRYDLERSHHDSGKEKLQQIDENQEDKAKRISKKQRLDVASTGNSAGPSQSAGSSSNKHTALTSGEGTPLGVVDTTTGAIPKATPAFFFFINENRTKIERALARKQKGFQRIPKGIERNALVTKEAKEWWNDLKPQDVKRYMDMSMQLYEQQIIEWKEEKTIRAMTAVDPPPSTSKVLEQEAMLKAKEEDDRLTHKNFQRIYRSTNVGFKSFKPEPGESHNRVLLELLQDMRFHPDPMVQCNRTTDNPGQVESERITIPYFDVQGPISTSLGDECFGCSRGWAHFCHVLKRRVPSVDHRAKLQPPISSLMATRVGLGLFDNLPPSQVEKSAETDSKDDVYLFDRRDVPEMKKANALLSPLSESLAEPSLRADDITSFIEEVSFMKAEEPTEPKVPKSRIQQETKKKKVQRRVALPIGRRRLPSSGDISNDGETGSDATVAKKCGRCRNTIESVTGCIPCRRAHLVINLSKRDNGQNSSNGSLVVNANVKPTPSLLKVHPHMLGRLNDKDTWTTRKSTGDESVENQILRERWTPFAILPPTTISAPLPKSTSRHQGETKQNKSAPNGKSEKKPDQKAGKPSELRFSITGSINSSSQKQLQDELSESAASSRAASPVDGMVSEKDLGKVSTGPADAASKRTRSRSGQSSPTFDVPDRPQISQELNAKMKELNKKMVPVACFGIFLAMVRRDPLLLFADTPEKVEGYSAIIQRPMDFSTIQKNLLDGKYTSLGAFVTDARLICTNALFFNAAGSIYAKTAQELLDILTAMHKRASKWMTTLKDALALAVRQAYKSESPTMLDDDDDAVEGVGMGTKKQKQLTMADLLCDLKKEWPDAVKMLNSEQSLREKVKLDFRRTKENEIAYYAAIAIRRTAIAAAASLTPYPDSGGALNPVCIRTDEEDEELRRLVFEKVAKTASPPQLKDIPTWREESVIRILRKAQDRRVESMADAVDGCSRTDGANGSERAHKIGMAAEALTMTRKRKSSDRPRIDKSRKALATGVGSMTLRDAVERRRSDFKLLRSDDTGFSASLPDRIGDAAVSVKGSRIHGWGLFADQPFTKGDFVAEYIGEYVSPAVTDAREKLYQQQRIQDYQFRIDHATVIDATMRGGHGRYINHSCTPNCVAKIVPGNPPNQHLQRVIILADRDIAPSEEFSYDYSFPLEEDLRARIPCNCQSESCRGFMNWDLPEKGSSVQDFRSQKRKGNMRDRIRRLGRPLKAK